MLEVYCWRLDAWNRGVTPVMSICYVQCGCPIHVMRGSRMAGFHVQDFLTYITTFIWHVIQRKLEKLGKVWNFSLCGRYSTPEWCYIKCSSIETKITYNYQTGSKSAEYRRYLYKHPKVNTRYDNDIDALHPSITIARIDPFIRL